MAPLRFPPALIASVAASKTFMKLTGPEATPLVDLTRSPFGRSVEKLNPTPPPVFSIRAMFLRVVNTLSSESWIGRTKHAESWPMFVPALNRVGVLGRNSSFAIML